MKSKMLLLVTVLALGLHPRSPAAAQEIALRRDIPAPVAVDCTAADAAPVATPATQDATEAARLVTAAREAALLGNPRTARDLLWEAAAADTSAANIAYLFARTLEELGEIELAVREYCRYLRLAPDAPDAADIRDLTRRIAPPRRPGVSDTAVALFQEALAFADAGRPEDAELMFGQVITAEPSWSTPYYNRAVLRTAAGRLAEARVDLEQFLSLEPARGSDTGMRAWMARLSTPVRRYSAGAAFALGLIPGGGHFYTGRPVAGTALLAIAGGAAAVGVLYEQRHVECLTVPQNNVCPAGQIREEHVERPYLVPALGVAATAAILGAIDAVRGARSRNARAPGTESSRLGSAVRFQPARVDIALLSLRF